MSHDFTEFPWVLKIFRWRNRCVDNIGNLCDHHDFSHGFQIMHYIYIFLAFCSGGFILQELREMTNSGLSAMTDGRKVTDDFFASKGSWGATPYGSPFGMGVKSGFATPPPPSLVSAKSKQMSKRSLASMGLSWPPRKSCKFLIA